jgi:gliding motility-associated-like protein
MLSPRFLICFVLMLMGSNAMGQLQVNTISNAQQLAQYLVGEGVVISNVTLSGSPLSSGLFKNISGTNIGLDSGIVLSTGRVETSGNSAGLNGPAANSASTFFGYPGDVDLSTLVNKITKDAVFLEFDLVPQGDTISFRYVFSSEEYNGFICTNYNDVFAFFISGPGIVGTKNIALVPGTDIPVAINSINNGSPGMNGNISTCNAMGAGSPFTQYYLNNMGNPFFTHDGHTKVLTAVARVEPCKTYRLKIAIADVLDEIYDSNVFLEARSLRSPPIKLESANPLIDDVPYLAEGCHTGAFNILRDRRFPYAQEVNLSYAGTALNGVDVELLPSVVSIAAGDSIVSVPIIPVLDNLDEGTEYLKIYVSNGCDESSNYFLDSLVIQIRDFDVLKLLPKDTLVCRNNPVQFSAPGNFSNFQWTPSAGLSDPSIANPALIPDASQTFTCTATLDNCTAKDSIKVVVKAIEVLSSTDIICRNGNTGEIKVSGGYEWVQPVQYNINGGAYFLDSVFSNLTAGNYIIRAKDNSCTDSIQLTLLQLFPDLLLYDSIVTASCTGQNGELHLQGSGGKQPYSYSLDNSAYSMDSSYTGITGGIHNISIRDDNGCVEGLSVNISNDLPIQVSITVDPESCKGVSEGRIFFEATGGSGDFLYSVNGGVFQVADSFMVNETNITGTVKDSKGCSATKSVVIPLHVAVFVDAGNDTTICEGSKFIIPTQGNAFQYHWQPSPSLNGNSRKEPEVSPIVTTTYYVTATRDICVVKDSITITVNPAPIANAGEDQSVCLGRTVTLSGSGAEYFSWFPAASVSDPSSSAPVVKPTADSRYLLKVTDLNGCTSLEFDTVWVFMVPDVQAFAGRDTSIEIGNPLQLHGSELGNRGITRYSWSPVTGLNNPDIPDPIAIIERDITYTLTLETAEGCEGSAMINIRAFEGPEIYVPNAFTPNDDGRNDVLRAFPVGLKEFRSFRVFNRWGELIFSTNDQSRGWDGTIKGLKQNTGTFIWVAEAVDLRGNPFYRRGSVTLIR